MQLSRYEILKHKKLLTKTQPPTDQSLKTFTESISFYIKFFVPVLISTLFLLDYLTFTTIFNFEPATYFDIYLYNVNISDSSLLLIVGFFPLVGVVLVYMISYLIALASISINAAKFEIPVFSIILKKLYEYLTDKSIWINIFLIPILFVLLLSSSSYLIIQLFEIMEIKYWTYLLISFSIPLLIAHSGTIKFLMHYKNTQQYTSVSVGVFFMTIIYIISIAFIFVHFKLTALSLYLYLLLFPTLFSFQIIDVMIDNKPSSKHISISPTKRTAIILIGITIIIVIGTTFFYDGNKTQWTNKDKNQTMTMNLFLNKNFLSSNTELIDINCSNFRGKDWNQSIQHLVLDQNAMYLPISKEMKLYFTDINNTEKTKIYAVQKQFYKGETYFKLYDVGSFKESK